MYLPLIFPFLQKWPEFVWDDRAAVLGNPDVQPSSPVLGVFQHDFWGHHDISSPDSHKSYRPLTVLSLRVDNTLWGPSALAFLVHNTLLHLINAFLVGALAYRLCSRSWAAGALGAVTFLLHPLQTEAVSSIVGRADLLVTLWVLLGCLAQVELCRFSRRRGSSTLFAAASALGVNAIAVLATLSKETGVAAWAVLLLIQALAPLLLDGQSIAVSGSAAAASSSPTRSPTKAAGIGNGTPQKGQQQRDAQHSVAEAASPGQGHATSGATSPAQWLPLLQPSITVAVAAAFLRWRISLNDGRLFPWTLYENQLPGIADGASRALTILETHAHYASLVAWPFGRLSYYHGYAEIAPAVRWSAWSAAAVLLYALAAAAAAMWVWRVVRYVIAPSSSSSSSKVRADDALQRKEAARAAAVRLLCLVGLVAAPFAPAANVFVYVGTEVAERLLYLPLAGIAVLAAALLAPLLERECDAAVAVAATADDASASAAAAGAGSLRQRIAATAAAVLRLCRRRKLAAACIAVISAACVGAGVTRSVEWADERSLFAAGVRVAPASVKALTNLGTLLAASPLVPAPATAAATAAAGDRVRHAVNNSDSSMAGIMIHDWAAARRVAAACVAVFPASPACWSTLGALAQREEFHPETEAEAETAASLWALPLHLSGTPAGAGSSSSSTRSLVEAISFSLSAALDSVVRGPVLLASNAAAAALGWGASGDQSQSAATAAGDSWQSILRRLPATAPELMPSSTPSVAAADGNGNGNGNGTRAAERPSGQARALEYLWRSVQGSADTRLPLPCVTAEGLADIYLAIADERERDGSAAPRAQVRSQSQSHAQPQTEEQTQAQAQSHSQAQESQSEHGIDDNDGAGVHLKVVDGDAAPGGSSQNLRVPLPRWAIKAGGAPQLRWLRNLKSGGRSLHAAQLALLFVDAAGKLGCGSLDATLSAADADSARVAQAAAAAGNAGAAAELPEGASGTSHAVLDLTAVHVPLHALTSASLWHRRGNAQQHLRLHLLALAQYARVPAALLRADGGPLAAAAVSFAFSCQKGSDAVIAAVALRGGAPSFAADAAPAAEDSAVPDVAALLACATPGGDAAVPLPERALPAGAPAAQLASSASMASFALRAVVERLDRGVSIESATARLCAALSADPAAAVPDGALCKAQLLSRASALSELAVRLQPHDAAYHTNAASAALAAGAIEAGLTHAHDALQLRPSDPSVLTNYGYALERSGRDAEALEAYRLAAALAPHHQQIMRNYESLRQRLGLQQ